MRYYLVLKNEEPEKLITSLDEKEVKKEDISFWLMSHSILNVFDDEEIANQVMSSMLESEKNLNTSYRMVELHQIDFIKEMN